MTDYYSVEVCPRCGNRTLEVTVRADECTAQGCGYYFYYPDATVGR